MDCHAESLLKRAFKRYLIGVIDNWLENQQQIDSIDKFYDEGLFGNDKIKYSDLVFSI